MISRQWSLKTIRRMPKESCIGGFKVFHSFRNEYHLHNKTSHPNATSANRSMLSCLQKNIPLQAISIFKMQLQLGIAEYIDQVTVSLALKASQGDLKYGCQFHAFAISSGFISHITVSNSLMNMYSKSGQFGIVLAIFESLTNPDIVSWNTMLSGFEKSVDALNFALRMNLNGVVFDPVTYTTVLAFCSNDEELLFGMQLHSPILKHGLDCEVFVGNALISMYSRWGQPVEARKVFDELPNKDLVSWNAMISGYTQGDYGLDAVLMFISMVREGMMLDHVSFTSAISACGHEKDLQLGRQIHGMTMKMGYAKHISCCNVLISVYSKCEVIEEAKSVFYSMHDRNVVSWTTMISIDEESSVSLFNMMRMDGVYPNDVTFIALIHAITVRNLVKEGQMVHGFCIKSSFLSEPNVCNSLITMYANFESMEEATKTFEELDYRDTVSWNALISGDAQNGLSKEALQTFLFALIETKPNQYTFGSVLNAIGAAEDIPLKYGQRCHSNLLKLGFDSDPIVASALLDMYAKRGSMGESQRVFDETSRRSHFSWTAIISAYARHGDYESVMSLFKEMEKSGARPDSITFLSVLTACCRKGMVDVGHELFSSMTEEYSIEPSAEHYSCIVDMLGRAGKLDEAEELMSQIPGGPKLSVLQSLLGSCRLYGNKEIAERVANFLMRLEPTESGSYVLLSNLYAEKGEWEKVAQMRKRMRERGVKKEVGFSWVDVDDDGSMYMHGFSSGDKSHPQCEEICRMAEFVGLEMKFLRKEKRDKDLNFA